MLHYLIKVLRAYFEIPGIGVFDYISFRAGGAAVLSLFISIVFGKKIIRVLKYGRIKDDVRAEDINQNNARKKNTPTMGGVIIILSTIIPTLLFSAIHNVYVILLTSSLIWMGIIGFADDYIKVFRKNKRGLAGHIKVLGQVLLGIVVGGTLYFNGDVVIREKRDIDIDEMEHTSSQDSAKSYRDIKSTKTTVPFLKNNELDYQKLIGFFLPFIDSKYYWIFYLMIVTFIIAAISNGCNLTDGLDGLAASVSSISILSLAALAYISGNSIFSNYLNILYIPGLGELTIFCVALAFSCVGFLWYNTYPAQIFMGDTGSLSIGGVIAVLALCIRKELMLPLLCGIFVVETASVILQVAYFKYTKRKYGEGRRLFKMSPIHHHFQKKGIHEAKIVARFMICAIILAIFTMVTLKLR